MGSFPEKTAKQEERRKRGKASVSLPQERKKTRDFYIVRKLQHSRQK